ncbi:putative secreted protein [Paenibacillus riograndensis SBR5]|uniref:Putative secreted protein n=1 Tax=Paenibacillus riograndensis SBR5 TaxID=1073571 RepID=A0A0E4HAU5_9BACL|nr:putative secreted protein [Paenibacillus riograndensis SBR5]
MRRRLLLLFFAVIFLTACSSNVANNTPPKPTKSPEEVKKALSGLIEKRDEVEEFSAYYAQTTIDNIGKSDAYVYFIKNKEGIVSDLRFVVNYIGTAQINTKWIKINADGQIFEINHADNLIQKSFSYTTVQEVYDSDVYLDDLKMIKAMANAKKTIVRCIGGGLYQEDIVLSKRQKQAMQNVLSAYKNAGGVNELYGDEL